MRVLYYQTADGKVPVRAWLDDFDDRVSKVRISARLDLLAKGSRGDWKSVGGGVFELRIHFGSGYRICCAQQGHELILLLCGGEKHTQVKDIETAHGYWQDYKARTS